MNQTAVFARCLGLMAVMASLLVPIARAEELPSLERALRRAATRVLEFANERQYASVGVLKFRVMKSGGQLTDNAGPLNLKLAEQLELALILANNVDQPLGIVHDASSVAAEISGANHLSKAGREALLHGEYPLAWGETKVQPDAFFVGVAEYSPDLSKVTVGIAAFDRRTDKLQKVTQFDARPSVANLVDAGESFTVRGAFDGGQIQLAAGEAEKKVVEQVTKQIVSVREKAAQHPFTEPTAPVQLEVNYDNRPVPLEFEAGEARIREPQTGEKVTLALSRRDPTDIRRYACVLRVNGENTIFRQRQNDFDCKKWVLEPGSRPLVVRGFQTTDDVVSEFRILSKSESKATEMDYGADVGTILLTVFIEAGATTPKPVIDLAVEAEDASIISRGIFPIDKPRSFNALKSQLAATQTRGLIDIGVTSDNKTITVKFVADPRPIMSATIRYYRP